MPIIDFISQAIVCHDDDFRTAMTIANCLINHTAHVYSCIFNHDKDAKNSPAANTMSHQEKLLYNQLSNEFTTEDVMRVFNLNSSGSARMKICRLLKDHLIERIGEFKEGPFKGSFRKTGIILS